jgi:hypothetical protein
MEEMSKVGRRRFVTEAVVVTVLFYINNESSRNVTDE